MRLFFLSFSLLFFTTVHSQKRLPISYFPPEGNWEKRTPSELGLDSIKIIEAVKYAISNESKTAKNQEIAQVFSFGKEPFSDGVGPYSTRSSAAGIIIYKGYIVSGWGDIERVDQTHSVTKSFLSTVIGLATDRGLIKNVDDKVYRYMPPIEAFEAEVYRKPEDLGEPQFLEPFNTEHNVKISWDHLLRQTSDFEGTLWGKPDWADRPSDNQKEWLNRKRNEPGAVWKYNDTRVNALALAATTLWHRPLPEVLREYIMEPIGASNTWHWTGYRNSWIVLDGKLIQSVSGGGHFGGGLFINAIDMARFGLLSLHKGKWNGEQLISEKWIDQSTTPTTANTGYGFMNYFLNIDRKLLPSADPSVFVHMGNGTNMIYVDRKNQLVAVVRWIENAAIDGFVSRMLQALPQK